MTMTGDVLPRIRVGASGSEVYPFAPSAWLNRNPAHFKTVRADMIFPVDVSVNDADFVRRDRVRRPPA